MITQQVVTYIKDQLSRGMARDKIRSNLLSAGWIATDIDQAFSFAEPAGQNAALKIAPAFAVPDEVRKESPVDKTVMQNTTDNLTMPILKKDNPAPAEINLNSFSNAASPAVSPVVNPVSSPVMNPAPVVAAVPAVNLNAMPMQSPVQTGPAVMPVISPLANSSINAAVNPTPVVSPVKTDIVRTFSNEPVSSIANAPKKASGFLKAIAIFLTVVLVVGNVYVWLIVFPAIDKINTPVVGQIQNPNTLENDQIMRETAPNENVVEGVKSTDDTLPNTPGGTNPTLFLEVQAKEIHSAAGAYFSKYNTYGGASMALGSCNASGTVFSDTFIKNALSELSNLTRRVPQCALIGDDSPSAKIRTVAYIVYVPMEDAGFCVDSTGAAIVVSKTPSGLNCASGL